MANVTHYDGAKILSLKDINGKRPEIYIVTSNRTDGKTTFFSRMEIKRFKRFKKKFMYIVRFKDQISNVSNLIFNNVQRLFFPSDEMTHKTIEKGNYAELYLNGEHCGYAVVLNAAPKLKLDSSLFIDADSMWLDEFQTMGKYCTDEVQKLIDLHYTVARGNGAAYRYVPIYLTGNHLDLFNPYYVAWHIAGRLKIDTHFMRGDGWVIHQNFNKSVIDARADSGVTRANINNTYIKRDTYLYDDLVIMEKPAGYSKYLCTIKYKGQSYGIYDYGYCAYFTSAFDSSFKTRFAITKDDIDNETPHINLMPFYKDYIKRLLKAGAFTFRNPECKAACFEIFYNI